MLCSDAEVPPLSPTARSDGSSSEELYPLAVWMGLEPIPERRLQPAEEQVQEDVPNPVAHLQHIPTNQRDENASGEEQIRRLLL